METHTPKHNCNQSLLSRSPCIYALEEEIQGIFLERQSYCWKQIPFGTDSLKPNSLILIEFILTFYPFINKICKALNN